MEISRKPYEKPAVISQKVELDVLHTECSTASINPGGTWQAGCDVCEPYIPEVALTL